MANTIGTSFAQDAPGGAFDAPAFHAAAVTPSNTTDLATVARFLYIGTSGDVTLDTPSETSILFKNVPNATFLRVVTARVRVSGTSATNIVALW